MGLAWYNGFSPGLRAASWTWLKAEVASGRVPQPVRCEACGETRGQIDHHTEDYSRPFGPHIYQYQLCFRCHMALHSRFRNPEMWSTYIAQLEAGAAYEPLMSRKHIGAIWIPGWAENPIARGAARGERTFFRSLSMDRGIVRPRQRQAPLFD